ncbi:MAG: hypothetical protein ACI9XO_004836 [Paraglaciecola sp.]
MFRSDDLDAVSNVQKNNYFDLYPTPIKDILNINLKDETILGLDIFNIKRDLVKVGMKRCRIVCKSMFPVSRKAFIF